jgi:hypothetical protein
MAKGSPVKEVFHYWTPHRFAGRGVRVVVATVVAVESPRLSPLWGVEGREFSLLR